MLSPEHTCKICDKENNKFKTEVNFKKASVAKPAHLNVPLKFASPERIKLTLQQKRLEFNQLERINVSNEKIFDL